MRPNDSPPQSGVSRKPIGYYIGSSDSGMQLGATCLPPRRCGRFRRRDLEESALSAARMPGSCIATVRAGRFSTTRCITASGTIRSRDTWSSFDDEDLGFVIPDLPDGVKTFLAGFCRRIASSRRNRTIPYAFQDDSEAVFALRTADIAKLDDHTGLTCSTFVLTVLRSVGIRVIDRIGWPFTEEDARIQRRIAGVLRRAGWPEQADIIEAEADRKVSRRPQHVAGALLEDSADFRSVISFAYEHRGGPLYACLAFPRNMRRRQHRIAGAILALRSRSAPHPGNRPENPHRRGSGTSAA